MTVTHGRIDPTISVAAFAAMRDGAAAIKATAPHILRDSAYCNEAMSITKRYFTSLLSRRSYASLIC